MVHEIMFIFTASEYFIHKIEMNKGPQNQYLNSIEAFMWLATPVNNFIFWYILQIHQLFTLSMRYFFDYDVSFVCSPGGIVKWICVNENTWIASKISLKFSSINTIPV